LPKRGNSSLRKRELRRDLKIDAVTILRSIHNSYQIFSDLLSSDFFRVLE